MSSVPLNISIDQEDLCRLCYEAGSCTSPLTTPCGCRGSLQLAHKSCIVQWINANNPEAVPDGPVWGRIVRVKCTGCDNWIQSSSCQVSFRFRWFLIISALFGAFCLGVVVRLPELPTESAVACLFVGIIMGIPSGVLLMQTVCCGLEITNYGDNF
ncbi:hypothetical protein L596_012035 [Steinernema carpocapsae]|uniref:RING-CH-type domain-containing protein n=1 Tax=Steinernema carpocapsae TaxID=34508 RepID=A0A4U5NW73_STECR|nr:hypothetical protein L596_012035 [Steinernema carpocapsae]